MTCLKCEKELYECICPDLHERLREIYKCKWLIIPDSVRAEYDQQAARNKALAEQQMRQE